MPERDAISPPNEFAASDARTRVADPADPEASSSAGADDFEAPMFDPGTMLAGRYRIIRRLGIGGMGEVYLAEHVDIEREVAIKTLISRWKKKGGVERFMQEARTASRIRHPNIVDITDFRYMRQIAPIRPNS